MKQTLRIDDFPQPTTARVLSPNGRAHWAVKNANRDYVHLMVGAVAKAQELQPMAGHVVLRPTFIVPQRRQRDDDNYATGVLKAVRDALVRGKYIEADDTDHLRQMPVEITVEKGHRALILELESAS